MKNIFILAFALLSLTTISCKKDKKEFEPISEIAGLNLVQKIENDTNEIELYTKTGKLTTGYNEVFIRIKEKANNQFKTDAMINWSPVMHMTSMAHSCPKSSIEKVVGKQTLYSGYLVFQMAENTSEHWTLALNFESNGIASTLEDTITVTNSAKKRVAVFTGTDSKKYVVALINPSTPQVASNNLVLGLFTMQNMMTFPIVEDYKIEIDPRMPSMGNHSSPNNENPLMNTTDKLYYGKLSLTMTGFWKINLILKNNADEIIAGNAIDAGNESSNLFLEIEF